MDVSAIQMPNPSMTLEEHIEFIFTLQQEHLAQHVQSRLDDFKSKASEIRRHIIETHEAQPSEEVPTARRSARLSNRGIH